MDRKQRPVVLLIDDMPVNLQVLTAALSADYQVQIAASGATGLTLAAKRPPDLILLDVMMPELDGFEVCRRLKADPVLSHVPVIFLTAMSVGASESMGLSLGAADYITKPINVEIARLRIGNLLEREGLRREVLAQRDSLRLSVEELTRTALLLQQARQRELDAGNFIQRSLLQGEVPQGIEGACFANFSAPSQGVNGDLLEIRKLHAGCVEVLVGDVMGKGVPAALIGAGIKTAYYQALATLMGSASAAQTQPTPAQIVHELHQLLTPRLAELEAFATLALYRFDLEASTLSYVNAGHTPCLLQHRGQNRALALLGKNAPIGVLASEVYTQSTLALTPGDKFLLFSDGVTEVRNAQGQEFGLERLSALFESGTRGQPCSCHQQIADIRQALQLFSNNAQVSDDQTLFMIELAHPVQEETSND